MDSAARALNLLKASAESHTPTVQQTLAMQAGVYALLALVDLLNSIDGEITQLRDDLRSRT